MNAFELERIQKLARIDELYQTLKEVSIENAYLFKYIQDRIKELEK